LRAEEKKEEKELTADRMIEELKEAPKVAQTENAKQEAARSAAPRKKSAGESATGSASFSVAKTIKGQVKATDGQPLPGVNVLIKGTAEGTVSDINGRYSISTAQENPNLVFSFVGLHTSEVKAKDTTNVDVTMREDLSQLSEVVVTGKSYSNRDDAQGPVIRLAEPYGGRKAYDKYLDDNIQYPAEALEKKVKGRVLIEFTVGTDGSISQFNVLRSLGYGCDEEVIRLVKEGPKWLPTTEDDVAVESNVRVRMKFDPAKLKK
jgi:TonB family protein